MIFQFFSKILFKLGIPYVFEVAELNSRSGFALSRHISSLTLKKHGNSLISDETWFQSLTSRHTLRFRGRWVRIQSHRSSIHHTSSLTSKTWKIDNLRSNMNFYNAKWSHPMFLRSLSTNLEPVRSHHFTFRP